MRIGVIRGDMPGPILVADLEPASDFNASTEPPGQVRYVGRPTTTKTEAALTASVAPAIQSATALSFGTVTITGASNDILMIRLAASGSYTTVTVAAAAYASLATLITAVNTALATAGVAATASEGTVANTLRITSNTKGAGSVIAIDSNGNGSTFNQASASKFGNSAQAVTVPTATTIITATLPVDGPLDVSTSAIRGVTGLTNATLSEIAAIADSIAPQFIETDILKRSVQVGNLSGYLSATYTPDPNRLGVGPAIEVVEDDGSTEFEAPLPSITTATLDDPTSGDVTLEGEGFGSSESEKTSVVITGDITKTLLQHQIVAAGGSVDSETIIIPADLLDGVAVDTTFFQVKLESLLSAKEVLDT